MDMRNSSLKGFLGQHWLQLWLQLGGFPGAGLLLLALYTISQEKSYHIMRNASSPQGGCSEGICSTECRRTQGGVDTLPALQPWFEWNVSRGCVGAERFGSPLS